jgi:hypothetical protein
MLLIVDLDHTPWVAATTDFATFGCLHFGIGTNDCEWHFRHDFVVLRNRLLVIQLIAWTFEDVDVVVVDVCKNLKQSLSICHGWRYQYTYTLLEVRNLLIGESVRLGDDWNEVDLGVESTHDLNIQRLEGVASGLDKVDTSMHAVINNVHPVHLVLGVEICIESLLDVLDDWPPRIIVVHEVTKARGIHDGQAEANAIFLNIGGDGLNADGLGSKVERRLLALLWWVKRGVE